MPMPDLDRIQRLRDLFLEGRRGRRAIPDYWRDARDLEAQGVTRVYTPKDFELNNIMGDLVGFVRNGESAA